MSLLDKLLTESLPVPCKFDTRVQPLSTTRRMRNSCKFQCLACRRGYGEPPYCESEEYNRLVHCVAPDKLVTFKPSVNHLRDYRD